ncbi:hypothetical protein ACQ4N7_19990 [Nodosilinea sp. AN01ver1]|uniref:hypothetical protein n=1 Tax=Nodosilinea sp. AN01ver1 TaxID=3423362 RepID=UPI003D31512C
MDFEDVLAWSALTAALLMLAVSLTILVLILFGFITVLPCDDSCQYAPMIWPLPGGGFSIG